MKISEKLPSQFIKRINTQLGEEAQQFLEALNKEIPVSIRVNTSKEISKIDSYELDELDKIEWNENGYYLPERPIFTIDPGFQAGAYYVQEASSMFLTKVIREILPIIDQSAKILDLCAAPGGKSTLILDAIPDSMLLISNEVIKSRASTLVENITKWGKANVIVTNNDPRDFRKLEQYFDVIVVDAPCSGEGMFRKDLKAIEEWSEENILICEARQQRIIDEIIPSLKSNGFLIYCTCTFSPKENRENVQEFTTKYGLKSLKIPLEASLGVMENEENSIYSYHFYPHKLKGEGFFLACLQKKQVEEIELDSRIFKFEFLSKKQIPLLHKWIANLEQYDYIIWKDIITALPIHLKNEISFLSRNLFILKKGVEIGKIMGSEIIPSHELALSEVINKEIQVCELNKEEALIYLKKGDVSAFEAVQIIPNGWALVRYLGNNLGWIKKIGNRTNNYLPKELRILKDF